MYPHHHHLREAKSLNLCFLLGMAVTTFQCRTCHQLRHPGVQASRCHLPSAGGSLVSRPSRPHLRQICHRQACLMSTVMVTGTQWATVKPGMNHRPLGSRPVQAIHCLIFDLMRSSSLFCLHSDLGSQSVAPLATSHHSLVQQETHSICLNCVPNDTCAWTPNKVACEHIPYHDQQSCHPGI